jgi:hypothetical protein
VSSRSASRTRGKRLLLLATLSLGAAAWTRNAAADTLIINRPGYHQRYNFEAEPHLLLGFIDPPGAAHGTGLGVGFRGTVQVLENGFVPKINNSIGIGFGLDVVHYGYGGAYCADPTPAGCRRYDDARAVDSWWLPVVMQWNFWLSRNWSVFGEPGMALRYETNVGGLHQLRPEFLQFYLGGRYHFADTVTLTMRVGYPTFSVGVSFLL